MPAAVAEAVEIVGCGVCNVMPVAVAVAVEIVGCGLELAGVCSPMG